MFLCPSDDGIEVMDLQDAIDTATLNGYLAVEGWEDLNDFYSMANLILQRHIIYIEPVRLL